MKRTGARRFEVTPRSQELQYSQTLSLGHCRAASRRADEQEGEVELKGRGREPGARKGPKGRARKPELPPRQRPGKGWRQGKGQGQDDRQGRDRESSREVLKVSSR